MNRGLRWIGIEKVGIHDKQIRASNVRNRGGLVLVGGGVGGDAIWVDTWVHSGGRGEIVRRGNSSSLNILSPGPGGA